MGKVIDFSASVPNASDIKKSGYSGAVVYISPARESWMKGKNFSRASYDAYRKAGLDIAFVWQYGGATSPDALRGYAGGVADAKAAKKKLAELGRPKARVFFSVDFDIALTQWNNTATKYFDGVASVLPRDQVGIYGHSRVISWAAEDAKIANLGGGKYYAWQTKSWSAGVIAPEAVLYQGTHNVTGPSGVQVDINDVKSAAWCKDSAGSSSQPSKEQKMKYDTDLSAQFSFGGPRSTSGIKRVVIHTTENAPGTPPENVAQYQISSQTGSYHVLVGSTGRTVLCNTDDWTTWSTGNNAGNVEGLNLSFTVYSAQSRADWIKQDAMLEAGAKQAAEWCKKYGIPAAKTDGTVKGICGHGDLRRYGGTDHTDPGANFPWDVFIAKVKKHYSGASSSTSHEKDEEMAVKDFFEKTTYPSAVKGSKVKNSLVNMIRLIDSYSWQLVGKKYASKVKGSAYANTLPEYITDISANVVSLQKQVKELSEKIDADKGKEE